MTAIQTYSILEAKSVFTTSVSYTVNLEMCCPIWLCS